MRYLKNAWYVAAWAHELTDGLFPRTILNKNILFFRRTDGSVAAIDDYCPHRFAPLHMGRLVGDHVQCGYHGLEFDGSGACVRNPHGDKKIPKAAKVRSYAVVERFGVIWLWAGEAERADAETIPDFSYITAPDRKTIFGGKKLQANYELIVDNLMDASHTQYVHQDLLGTRAFETAKHEVIREEGAVNSNYLVSDTTVPEAYRPYFPSSVQVVDYSVNFRWLPPGLVRNNVYLTPKDDTSVSPIHRIGSHLMTPETDTSTHYFFCHTRNFDLNDLRIDERTKRWQKSGLTEQDGPIIEGCQAVMGQRTDLMAMKPVLLSTDGAAVGVRRFMDKLVAAEEAAMAPAD